MSIDRAYYHGWPGRLGSPARGTIALVRVGLLQVFRRKLYWGVLALGFMQFLLFFMSIYAVTQTTLPPETQRQVLKHFGFSPDGGEHEENGYTMFMERQSLVVMILLAFSGSLLVGADFRQKSLPFYLSRRLDRRHYIVGKLLAVGAIVSILTTLPALVLFIEFGLLTGSAAYWIDHWHIVMSVLAYGLVLALVLGILLVTLSAYLQRLAPIAIIWSSLFLLLRRLAWHLFKDTDDASWLLLDPWHDIHSVGKLCFLGPTTPGTHQLALWSLAILTIVCSAALVALVHRVRAVEIVQ